MTTVFQRQTSSPNLKLSKALGLAALASGPSFVLPTAAAKQINDVEWCHSKLNYI